MAFTPLPLSLETLEQLLGECSERPGLDYKRECDLSDTRATVELVKDLGAMQVRGGYIVVGADDQGQPSGRLSEREAKLFDQATLHSKAEKYLGEGFEIRSTWLERNGDLFGLVCVLPHPDGWSPFRADGGYPDPKAPGQVKTAFRRGETYGRHGTKSEPLNQEDVRLIVSEVRRREREAARDELREVAAALGAQAASERGAAGAPAPELSWNLDAETLTGAVIEQVRRNDLIPVQLLLKSLPRDAVALMTAGAGDDLDVLLDRLTCLLAAFLHLENDELAERVVATMATIFNATFAPNGLDEGRLRVNVHDLRLHLITRVIAGGALAVREQRWAVARALATVRPAAHDADYWQNWIFYAEVWAARAGLLNDDTRIGQSPLVLAQEHITRLACLRPDLAAEDEQVITSLCRFDMLAAFAAIVGPGGRRTEPFLAQFARWYAARTDPIVVALIEGGALRDTFYPEPDVSLAEAIRRVAGNASKMAGHIHGWHGYEDVRILRFLQDHPGA